MRAGPVVERDPRREAVLHELPVDRPSELLAVVVRARAPGQEAEPGAEPRELWAERVRDACFEPADHPCAPTRQHDAALPCLAQYAVEPVRPPDGEQVHSRAA